MRRCLDMNFAHVCLLFLLRVRLLKKQG